MSDIRAMIQPLAPLPWVAALDDDADRWGLTVIAADGKNIADRQMMRDEARMMAALHAFAPRAMLYVEQAAAKGGREAEAILRDFKRAAGEDLTPEHKMTALMGRQG